MTYLKHLYISLKNKRKQSNNSHNPQWWEKAMAKHMLHVSSVPSACLLFCLCEVWFPALSEAANKQYKYCLSLKLLPHNMAVRSMLVLFSLLASGKSFLYLCIFSCTINKTLMNIVRTNNICLYWKTVQFNDSAVLIEILSLRKILMCAAVLYPSAWMRHAQRPPSAELGGGRARCQASQLALAGKLSRLICIIPLAASAP